MQSTFTRLEGACGCTLSGEPLVVETFMFLDRFVNVAGRVKTKTADANLCHLWHRRGVSRVNGLSVRALPLLCL